VAIVCSLFFFVYLGNSLWLSLFPNHLLRLGMNSLLIGIILMVYNASLSLAYLPSGRLSDKVGRRPLIVVGCSLLAAGTLWLSLSSQAETTVLAVIIGGVGLALLVPSGNALISEVASGRGSGSVFAFYQIATLSATVVGSFAAGALAESAGFSKMFLISGIIAGATAVFGYLMIPETLGGKAGDYVSAVSESLRSSFTGTATLLRSNRELALLASALVIHSIGFSVINPFVPLFAEKGIRLDISQVGIIISVWNAGLALAQIPSGHMTDRFGARPLLLTHFVLSSFSWVFYALSWNLESGIATVFFFGIVGALDMPARRTIMIEYATAEEGKATIIGSLDAITGVVGIVGPLIGGILWAQIGYAAPFQLASFVNVFACVPLIAIMRSRARRRSISSFVKAVSQ
jgi:DHA1 family multidrug resistance protein-like MFS transporter